MSTNDEVQDDTSTDVGSEATSDRVSDEGSRLVDQEAGELLAILDGIEHVKEMSNPKERFYPTGREARRKAEKRNRALLKRKPNG